MILGRAGCYRTCGGGETPSDRRPASGRRRRSSGAAHELGESLSDASAALTPARNLGPAVNGPDHEFCPQLVDGGRRLLFSRDTPEGGVFQIDASVLDDPPTP